MSGFGDVGVELVEPRRAETSDACASHLVGRANHQPRPWARWAGADRLNWLAKKRRRNTSNQCRIVARS